MKKTIITVSVTVLTVLVCLIILPLFFGYKIAYYSDVKYDFEAIGAIGQWIGALIPIILVFLSAYVTMKLEESKRDVASSNLATVEYIGDIVDEKIQKLLNQCSKTPEKSEEELRDNIKKKAYKFVSISMVTNTEAVAKHLEISKEEAFDILQELLLADGMISCGGGANKDNMDNIVWLKKRR